MTNFDSILQSEVQEFIKLSENQDIAGLVLKGSPFDDVDIQDIAQQVKGRQVAKQKFPQLYNAENIVYPPRLNLEQASSQITAEYKVSFMNSGGSILDLTGGLGIDSIAFSSKFDKVQYCEINADTYNYAKHNFAVLETGIEAYHKDGIKYLENATEHFDWLYIDPSRRNQHGNRVFWLESCTPNVMDYIDLFRSKADQMLIKTSPLLDINLCLKQLNDINEIHVVAHKNEVKELLLLLDFKKSISNPKIFAVNLDSRQEFFKAEVEEFSIDQNYSEPLQFIYEPNSAIMKTGMFGVLCKKYNLKALASNSHLFTSNEVIEFPGRRFEVVHNISPQKKLIKKHLGSNFANISTRNYPLKPEQIKAKYGLKDGGKNYLFFTTNYKNEKKVLICKKINQT